jgi:hypothetical protein
MDEKAKEALKLQFDKRLRLEFHGAGVTSNAGAALYGSLVERAITGPRSEALHL